MLAHFVSNSLDGLLDPVILLNVSGFFMLVVMLNVVSFMFFTAFLLVSVVMHACFTCFVSLPLTFISMSHASLVSVLVTSFSSLGTSSLFFLFHFNSLFGESNFLSCLDLGQCFSFNSSSFSMSGFLFGFSSGDHSLFDLMGFLSKLGSLRLSLILLCLSSKSKLLGLPGSISNFFVSSVFSSLEFKFSFSFLIFGFSHGFTLDSSSFVHDVLHVCCGILSSSDSFVASIINFTLSSIDDFLLSIFGISISPLFFSMSVSSELASSLEFSFQCRFSFKSLR